MEDFIVASNLKSLLIFGHIKQNLTVVLPIFQSQVH